MSCAAGLAVLSVIEDEDLVENSRIVGAYLKSSLEEMATTQPLIADVRGTGLLVGLELSMDSSKTQQLIELMRESGVLVGASGPNRNVLKLRPPLIASSAHVDEFLEALAGSLSALA